MILRYRQEGEVPMKHRSLLVASLVLASVSFSCGGTSTVPGSPSSETSNNKPLTTQPEAGTSVPETETELTDTEPTTTSAVVDGSASTTEPDDADAEAGAENSEPSETNQKQTSSTTSPSAPTTTYGIVTEEPANVFSGGVETWEPDA